MRTHFLIAILIVVGTIAPEIQAEQPAASSEPSADAKSACAADVAGKSFDVYGNREKLGRLTFGQNGMTSGLWVNRYEFKDGKLFVYSPDTRYVTVFEKKDDDRWSGKRDRSSPVQDRFKFQLRPVQ